MAGHSQFKNIMHRKGRQDAQRAKIFTKLIREITTVARLGAADPNANPRLRAAMIAAREANMTRDTIDRAIKRGSGSDADANYDEIRYEGYGPAGVALIVEALTNNRNRTAGEVRSIFSKHGGNLGESNSVSFMFDRVGEFRFPLSVGSADEVLEKAIEVGADDVVSGQGEEACTRSTLPRRTSTRCARRSRSRWASPRSPSCRGGSRPPRRSKARRSSPARPDRGLRRQRRRPERLRQFRGVGRRSGEVRCLKPGTTRLIGLDPGLRLTGWGVIDVDGNKLRHVAHGVVRVTTTGTLAARLCELFDGVAAIVETQRPLEAAIEETFVNVNPDRR